MLPFEYVRLPSASIRRSRLHHTLLVTRLGRARNLAFRPRANRW